MNPMMGLLMAGGGMGAQDAGAAGQQMMKKPPGMGDKLMGLLGDPKMHMALSLLESGGYQQQPVSLGQALARAGVAGANAIQMQQKMDMDRNKAELDARHKVAQTRNQESLAREREAARGDRDARSEHYRELLNTLDPEERRVFESMTPEQGAQAIAARRVASGEWEDLYNEAGQPYAQRNTKTGRVASHPAYSVVTDPLGGQPFAVDRQQGTATPLMAPTSAQAPEIRERPAKDTIFGRIGDAVGVKNWFTGEVYNRTLGQVFGADEKVAEARAELMGLRENVITALAKSGRPPVVEQQRILERFPNFGPGESVGGATASLRSIYRDLEMVMEDDLEFSRNSSNPVGQRRDAIARARSISETLSRMGPPPTQQAPAQETLPGGVTVDWLDADE